MTSRTSRNFAGGAAKSKPAKPLKNTPPFADLGEGQGDLSKAPSYACTAAITVKGERDGFRRHLEQVRRASSTIENYLRQLGPFASFLDGHGVTDLRAVTAREIDAYEAHLGSGKLKVQTQRMMLRGLKRFFEHLVGTGKLFVSPAEHLRDPKEHRPAAPPLRDAEIARLLGAPDLRTKIGVRDRAILELLRATGIRRQELCNLCVFDVDADGGHVRVRSTTGASERVVPIDGEAGKWLKKYLREARPHLAKNALPGERRLFLAGQLGKPLSPAALWQVLRRYGVKTRVAVSCLAFRRTAAAALERSGLDRRTVKQILGLGMPTGETA
jgi:integrase/recombinase XerD